MVLLRPKWLAGHALALVLTSLFIAAGFWQIARNRQANDKLAHEKAVLAADAPAIGTVDITTAAARGSRVSATGTFVTGHDSLLRNQLRGDKNGGDVLTPFRLTDGTVVLVDRGWISDDTIFAGWRNRSTPSGQVLLRGPLQPAAPLRANEVVKTEAGLPSYPRADVARIGSTQGLTLAPAYITATYTRPAPVKGAPQLPQPAKVTQVNHISYAIQWFAFASIAIIGWPIVLGRALKADRRQRRPQPQPA